MPNESDFTEVVISQLEDDRNRTVQVTVVIPTIGRPSLVRAVDSVLGQTLAATRLLVIADGVEYAPVVRQLLANTREDIVDILAIPRVGAPARVRNAGLQRVSTEFVAWLDDDDYWISDKLEVQATLFKPGVVAVSSNAFVLTNAGATPLLKRMPERTPFRKLIGENPVITSTVVCRTDALNTVGGFPETPYLLDDYAAWCRLACEGDFWISDQTLAVYSRDDPNSVSNHLAKNVKRKFHDNVSQVVLATMRYTVAEMRPVLTFHCAIFLIRYAARRPVMLARRVARATLQNLRNRVYDART